MAHECGKVVSRTHRPSFPPRGYSWYSFLLEAESTPGIISMKNSNDAIGNRTRDLPAGSTVPQPTAPPGAPREFKRMFRKFVLKILCPYTVYAVDVIVVCRYVVDV